MLKRIVLLLALCGAASSIFASGGGTASKPLSGIYPIVLSHGMLGWGEESTGIISNFNYWGGMDDYLRSEGATVYAPAKSPETSNEVRAQELKEKVEYWMAANGFSRVHFLGHSQGPLDVRYAVTNLGLASKTSSITSLNGANHGTGLADGVSKYFPEGSALTGLVESFVNLMYVVDNADAPALNYSLSSAGAKVFNQYTPNVPGIRYYSYGSTLKGTNLIQNPIASLFWKYTGDQSQALGLGFANDGFVPLESMYWGEWKGEPGVPWYSNGVDHLQTAAGGATGFDQERFYLDMALNMKAGQ